MTTTVELIDLIYANVNNLIPSIHSGSRESLVLSTLNCAINA